VQLDQGSVAVVTGAGSGLGAATASRLVAAGATVLLADMDDERGKQTAEALGDRARFVHCDVTSPDDAEATAAAAAELGAVRVLVNCAGINLPARVLGKSGPSDLDRFTKVVTVNLIGTFNMIRTVSYRMSSTEPVTPSGERGVIVNTASVAAFEGQVGQASYSASKGGVVGMTLPIARELASFGVRVMTIAPGVFETPMVAALPEDTKRSLGESVPFPSRLGTADEYARLVMSILDNEMLNGEVIRLDGAIRMPPR